MAFLFAVVVGLVAWPLISHSYPSKLFSYLQIPFTGSTSSTSSTGTHIGKVISPQLSAFIKDTLALENITGLAVAVIPKHGQPEFHSWGYRTEDGDPVTQDTLFHMASVSKAFCATSLGLLIDDFANGKNVTALPPGLTELTWHTRLKDLLPDWQLMDTWASERTNLRDILSHVSGIPRYDLLHDSSYGPSDTPLDMIRKLKHLRPAFELRERWSYNNIMYMVASHVIATYSGQPYTSFVEERIFTPLGMVSSTFSPAKAEAYGKFTQGWIKEGRRVPECFTGEIADNIAGAGGVISSAVDMTKWISTWINEGVYENQTVIPSSVYWITSDPYAIAADPTNWEHSIVGYGMGWFRTTYRGRDIVYHGGNLPGLTSLVAFLPSDELGVILFANADSKNDPMALILSRILDSALGLSSTLTPTWSLTREALATQHKRNATMPPLTTLDAFAGTYTNPGYGSFTLCGPSSVSTYCTRVQSDFGLVDHAQGSANTSGNLLAEWSRVWTSHVRLRHQRDFIFEFLFTSLYPKGYGKDATPFEYVVTEALAEFVIEDGQVLGVGLSGLIGELTEQARKGKDVRNQAEVRFDKVS